MRRARTIFLAASLVLAGVLTRAQLHGVYYTATELDGHEVATVHRMGFVDETNNYGTHIFHASGTVNESDWTITWNAADATVSSGGCMTYLGPYSSSCVLFNDRLFFPYIINTDCTAIDKGRRAKVAVYDLKTYALTILDLGYTAIPPSEDYCGAGAAATLLGGSLYVFTNQDTWISGDGATWTKSTESLVTSGMHLEPVDAITFVPPGSDAEHVLLLCHEWQWGYPRAMVWNGKWGAEKSVVWQHWGRSVHAANLIQGSAGGLAPGGGSGQGTSFIKGGRAKGNCIQMIMEGFGDGESTLWRQEVCFDKDSGAPTWGEPSDEEGSVICHYHAVPWFTEECTGSGVEEKCTDRQLLVVNYDKGSHCSSREGERRLPDVHFAVESDVLVPQYHGDDPDNRWAGYLTNTGSDQATSDWKLLGIIAGPAPFVTNGETSESIIKTFSNVLFVTGDGLATTNTHNDSVTMLEGFNFSMKRGFGAEGEDGKPKHWATGFVNGGLQQSYKHIWGTKTTSTTTLKYTLGTTAESDDFGVLGWAIFRTPLIQCQKYQVFAYDGSSDTGRFLYTERVKNSTLIAPHFRLDDPSNCPGVPAGILAGMRTFPLSQDLVGWNEQSWEFPGSERSWAIRWGTGTYGGHPSPEIWMGTPTTYTLDQNGQTFDGDGWSYGYKLNAGLGYAYQTKRLNIEGGLTVGIDGCQSTFDDTTTIQTDSIGCSYQLSTVSSTCTDPHYCWSEIHVQPYMLQAVTPYLTDKNGESWVPADWVPTLFQDQSPWLMTWKVKWAQRIDGSTIGDGPTPASVAGRIQGGTGAGENADSSGSHYKVEGGVMGWQEEAGSFTPIPMTSQEFDPALGAVVKIGGHAFEAVQANGKWKKEGQVWKFHTRDSVKHDAFTLALDFGHQTWKFEANKAQLAAALRAGDGSARINLMVNDRFGFGCDVAHEAAHDWIFKVPKGDQTALEMRKFKGSYDPATGKGFVDLEGTLPETLPNFGDMTFIFNGHRREFPLHLLPDFDRALEKGKELVCKVEGAKLSVDLGRGTWSLSVEEGLHKAMAPQRGEVELRILVGGVPWYMKRHSIPNYTTVLKYRS